MISLLERPDTLHYSIVAQAIALHPVELNLDHPQ